MAALLSSGVMHAEEVGKEDGRFDYFFYEAVNQGRLGHYAAAFDLLQYCLELDSTSAAAKYELAQYYVLLGDRVKPGELLRDAVREEPDNYWYWQLLGSYYASVHKYSDAIEIYGKMAAQFPTRVGILGNLMSLYEDAGEYRKGLSVLDRIERLEGESMQWDLQRFQFYLELDEVDSAYQVVKPNIQWVIETFSDAVTNIMELNSIRALCRMAVRDYPDNLVLHYWNAVSEFRAGSVQSAMRAIDNGIAHISSESDKVDAAKLYTFKGDANYELGNMQIVFDSYEKAIALNPSDDMTANNYAYFLALDKRDLKKAEALSLRTITNEPHNATFLDTYAWILFARKQYKKSLVYIKKAVQSLTEPSADVMEHCGDIYFMNGDTESAMKYWQEALELHSESKTIERKIIQRKYIEDEE